MAAKQRLIKVIAGSLLQVRAKRHLNAEGKQEGGYAPGTPRRGSRAVDGEKMPRASESSSRAR